MTEDLPSADQLDEAFDDLDLSNKSSFSCSAGALQNVLTGTAEETYELAKRELASVGCPTWEDRVMSKIFKPDRVHPKTSVWVFGTDEGSDVRARSKLQILAVVVARGACVIV